MRNADFHRAIGKRIASLRKQREFTQKELARVLGVKPGAVFSFELGVRRVSLDRVPELMRVFRVTCDELLGLKAIQPLPKRRVSPAELHLIERVRELTAGDRRVVKRVAEALRR
jgi:transcriptional regulator with XRE-family HTH domain